MRPAPGLARFTSGVALTLAVACATAQGTPPPTDPAESTATQRKKAPVKPKGATKPVAKAPARTSARKSAAHSPGKGAKTQAVAHKATSAEAKPVALAAPPDAEAARELQREQASQRDELLARLDALKRDIATSEASRTEAADALAESERAISEINRKLHELGEQQSAVEARLASINQRRVSTDKTIALRQSELAHMLLDQYVAGGDDALKLFLSGDNPSRIQRELQYRDYVGQAQAALVVRLQGDLAQLQDLTTQAQQQNEILAGIASDQKEQRVDLVRQQDARRGALAQVSEKLEAQRAQAGVLERDERRLTQVVEELGKLIERQARESREREKQRLAQREKQLEQARRAGVENPVKSAPAGATAPAKGGDEVLPPIAYSGDFAALRGKLKLPVRGDIAGRFGTARSGGGPTWKGVFLRADAGTEVHAIAPGRVVFAEWLRGFGNLLIVDHGEEYLSIYGNNESLLKQPGDSVAVGEVVATVGNSGGIEQTGLYFEMRYQGKPFDPVAWAAPR